jgi:hypothetical protein
MMDTKLDQLCVDTIRTLSIEQASTLGWERDVGSRGRIIGMRREQLGR